METLPGPTDVQHRSLETTFPGEQHIAGSSAPLRAIRVADDNGSPIDPRPRSGSILGEVTDEPGPGDAVPGPASSQLSAERMRVLVAEDDPVNSRIVKKRLDRLDHIVHLTVNGEECASAFCENPRDFDIVLMDMQVRRYWVPG